MAELWQWQRTSGDDTVSQTDTVFEVCDVKRKLKWGLSCSLGAPTMQMAVFHKAAGPLVLWAVD